MRRIPHAAPVDYHTFLPLSRSKATIAEEESKQKRRTITATTERDCPESTKRCKGFSEDSLFNFFETNLVAMRGMVYGKEEFKKVRKLRKRTNREEEWGSLLSIFKETYEVLADVFLGSPSEFYHQWE